MVLKNLTIKGKLSFDDSQDPQKSEGVGFFLVCFSGTKMSLMEVLTGRAAEVVFLRKSLGCPPWHQLKLRCRQDPARRRRRGFLGGSRPGELNQLAPWLTRLMSIFF